MFRTLSRRNVGSLLGLLFGVALFSSAHATSHYPPEAHASQTLVTVRVIWLKSYEQVTIFCSFLAHRPPPTDGMILGCYEPSTKTIFAVQPTSFNDTRHLEILGHEFWHALGAEHPA